MSEFAAVVLAAGMGTRMKSALVKVLHELCGKPLVQHVVETVRAAGAHRLVVVVGHQAERVRQTLGDGVEYVLQEEQKGTGHAVLQAEPALADYDGPVLITFGDAPLYRSETIIKLLRTHRETGAAATVLTAVLDDPSGYGRVIRAADGSFARVVEDRDATPEEAAVREVNTGMCCVDAKRLFAGLKRLGTDNQQGEYYLPDVFADLVRRGERVEAVILDDPDEAEGINDRIHLARAERILRDRINRRWMEEGVTLVDPATVFIDADVRIGRDTVIYPFTVLRGSTVIGAGCRLGPFVHLQDARVEDGAAVVESSVYAAEVAAGSVVGPRVLIDRRTTSRS